MSVWRMLSAAALGLAACGGGDKVGNQQSGGGGADAPGCPETADAPERLAGVTEAQTAPAFWVERAPAEGKAGLLSVDEIADLNASGGAPAPGKRALTRRAWLEQAFAVAGQPKAALVPATLESFGIAQPASMWVDLKGVTSLAEREMLVDAAWLTGAVVLEMPEQKLVYLGRDKEGPRMALAPAGELPQACPGGGTTRVRAARPIVAPLDLGAGTKQGSLLERVTRIAMFARAPSSELAGVVTLRKPAQVGEPAACKDSQRAAIFVSPERPNRKQPLRVIATLSDDPGPVELALVDPAGKTHRPEMVLLGGPPFSYVVKLDAPAPGKWRAVLGDGKRVEACQTITVGKSRSPRRGSPSGPAWRGSRRRTESTENLYSAFVERLFDYPVEEDLTWPNLHTLLRDPERNILYDHLGHGEEDEIKLEPDCADLPYTLQAYFAWKLDLPFGFLRCRRGQNGAPPKCFEKDEDDPEAVPGTNLVTRDKFRKKDEVGAFQGFAGLVRNGVHSASGRTRPRDDDTDFYPVPLSRETLRPGTLYADPYGHLLVIAGWYPQTPGKYGILMGADAQPDATVGRRRFWRGNFLFRPDTKAGGAGFKAYRPRVIRSKAVSALTNASLKKDDYTPYSEQQYKGSMDDFYDAMEALINPRPLDASAMLVSLVDALEESVVRRINSVDNGEKFMATSPPVVDMPEGAAIFLTTGPWEDYSTPSRDLRILIAIDTVIQFPDAVKRAPERYGLAAGELDATLAALRKQLADELGKRKFSYTRSDGKAQELSLQDVVDRQVGFEVAYNPNDCAEVKWGAPDGSPEMKTCKRRAPGDQRKKREKYRRWFSKRERPAE